jgi:arylsulfatase A-like enzyme
MLQIFFLRAIIETETLIILIMKPLVRIYRENHVITSNMLLIILIIFFSSCREKQDAASPNLVVIMVDDMGYADVGFNGCEDIPTPNIDRIAHNGIHFTNAYVTFSVCSPSRAGFITGRYPQRFGYERNIQYRPDDPNMGLSKDEMTLASCLNQVGYYSGLIGKWHLGAHPSNHPLNRGFDEFYGHLGGGHRYMPEDLTIHNSYEINSEEESYRTWIMRNHDHEPIEKYLTDEFSDEAVDFIERNAGDPFFLFLSYNAPHTPLQATEKYLSRFKHIQDGKRRIYAAMISAVDDGVGLLLDKLEEKGIEKNTLVFFLSDNGGPELYFDRLTNC